MMNGHDDGDRDWVRCAYWLVHCQVLSPDHKAAQPTATMNDLAHTLRDGVVLCLLLNKLKPRSLDPKEYSQRPQSSQVGNVMCSQDSSIIIMFIVH